MGLLILGVVCLVPVLVITVAYYAHLWSSPWGVSGDWSGLAMMSLLYLSMVGGPLLVTVSALTIVRRMRAGRGTLLRALVGGAFATTWSAFFVAVRPPDVPVQIVAWVVLLSSASASVASYRWLRAIAGGAGNSDESASRPTRA